MLRARWIGFKKKGIGNGVPIPFSVFVLVFDWVEENHYFLLASKLSYKFAEN